jgi:hypothetical protein
MAVKNPGEASGSGTLAVSDWVACHNSTDNIIVLSCTISTTDSRNGITGIGLILNDSAGHTLASIYTEMSDGSANVSPSLNLAPGELSVGDSILAVAQGECEGQHFFFEQELTIVNC